VNPVTGQIYIKAGREMVFDRFFKNTVNQPAASSGLALPHPEEAMNPSATMANTNVDAVMTKWLRDWAVPAQHWDYWKKAIDLKVYDVYPPSLTAMGIKQETPAGTWEAGGKRYLAIKPSWLNPGVIAHEQAHNSYALLTVPQKAAFAALYNSLKNTDPLIKLLYSRNTYGLSNDIEGHAEVYRYIGLKMPEQLKQYYPKLFETAQAVNTVPAPGQPQTAAPATAQPQTPGQKAKIIPPPQPGTRTVIDQKGLPVAVSSGNLDILCGSCGVILLKGIVGGSFNNIVIKCPRCNNFNEI
jgi:hypothetical protein